MIRVDALSAFYDAGEVLKLSEFKHVNAWTEGVNKRPKTAAGMKVLSVK